MADCRGCVFWKCTGDFGVCRRYPPVVIKGTNYPETEWPWTRPDDFCGEHKDRRVDG